MWKLVGLIPDSTQLYYCVDSHGLLNFCLSIPPEGLTVLESIVLKPCVYWENGNRLSLSARVHLRTGLPNKLYDQLRENSINVTAFVDNALLRGTPRPNMKSPFEKISFEVIVKPFQPGQQFGIELHTERLRVVINGLHRAYLPFDFRLVWHNF